MVKAITEKLTSVHCAKLGKLYLYRMLLVLRTRNCEISTFITLLSYSILNILEALMGISYE